MTLEAQSQKVADGMVRVALMAPAITSDDTSAPGRAPGPRRGPGHAARPRHGQGSANGNGNGAAAGQGLDRLPHVHRRVLIMLGRQDREFRLSDLATELGITMAETMGVVSPLIADGLVELRPAPSYAAHNMRVAATDRGLSITPAPPDWADKLFHEVEALPDGQQQRLLRIVSARIGLLEQQGTIPVTKMCLSCRFFEAHRHPTAEGPHHCWFVDAPFGYRQLRLHCGDHIPGGPPNKGG